MYKKWQINVGMNCQQIYKISCLTKVKIFQKVFRGGATFLETPCRFVDSNVKL